MDAIEVQDAIVSKQGTLTPHFKLFSQCLIESAHGAGRGTNSHQFFRDFSYLMSTYPAHKHLGQGFSYFGSIAVIPLERLRVKLPFSISGDFQIFNASSGSHQVTGVGPIAIASAMRSAFSP